MLLLSICDNAEVMSVLVIVKKLILIIRVVIPIILILVVSIDMVGAIKVGDEDLLKSKLKKIPVRAIAVVAIFLIPSFVNLIIKLADPSNEYLKCLEFSTEERVVESFIERAEYLTAKAEETADYGDYALALKAVNNIEDQDVWQEYIDRLDPVFMNIQSRIEKANENNFFNKISSGNAFGNGSRQGMIDVAAAQIGNVGGQKFWTWWGYQTRPAWCAIFVSWVANENGLIDSGVIPSFQGCGAGADWFKQHGQWRDSSYTPSPGDIVFFNWPNTSYTYDHVGIVEYVLGDEIHTIEGNTSDQVKRCTRYKSTIIGYGVPNY
ncbi:MAG: CHAP domain-containing protein [Tenericutes bacterium]|nr:CHAP domain-containing protein [Mycoplasmatota bacterium]